MKKGTLQVSAIQNGTVIDHIVAGQALKIIRFLNLLADEHQVTVGIHLKSRSMGRKDIIKLEACFPGRLQHKHHRRNPGGETLSSPHSGQLASTVSLPQSHVCHKP